MNSNTSMFPHTVTLYNVSTEQDANFNETSVNYITILRGVLLIASKGVNVRESGLEGADAVNLYIPFAVDAVDSLTGKPKRHIGPMEFWRMEDKGGFWTLSDSGNCFFVKGEAVEPEASVALIEMKYDSVYNVTKVDCKDFGSLDMQHFVVGGK